MGPAEHVKPELQKEVLRVAGTELYQLVHFIISRKETGRPTTCDSVRSLSLGLNTLGNSTGWALERKLLFSTRGSSRKCDHSESAFETRGPSLQFPIGYPTPLFAASRHQTWLNTIARSHA